MEVTAGSTSSKGSLKGEAQCIRPRVALDSQRGRVAALAAVVGDVVVLGQDLPVLVQDDVEVDPARGVLEEVDVAELDHEAPVGALPRTSARIDAWASTSRSSQYP